MSRFDVDPPIRPEQQGGNGGWDFKMEPAIPPPEDWPIYGPPTPGMFEGMLDGYEEETVPPLGVTDEELGPSPGPMVDPQKLGPLAPPPVCDTEPGDPPSGGGGLLIPGMEEALDIPAPSIEEEARRLHRENVEKDPYGYFRDLY
jgi:hypothetical protein